MLDFVVASAWRSTLKRDSGTHRVGCLCDRCTAWLRFSLACNSVDYVSSIYGKRNRRRLKHDRALQKAVDLAAAELIVDLLDAGVWLVVREN